MCRCTCYSPFYGPNLTTPDTNKAPYKAVDVDAEGTLRLTFWHANENLKGADLPTTKRISGFLEPPANLTTGIILEAYFPLPISEGAAHWPKIFLESLGNENSTLLAVDPRLRCLAFNVSSSNSTLGAPILILRM